METLSLHFLHEQAGARFFALEDREAVAHYQAVEREYAAALEAVALHDAGYRELLVLTGSERVSFLHGMVTQDIKSLGLGQTAYAAMVTAKGAMVADARVLNRPEDLVLDLEPGTRARVQAFLEKYLISEDAEIRDLTPELGLLRLLGPKHLGVLNAALDPPSSPLHPTELRPLTLAGQSVWIAPQAGFGVAAVDLYVPRAGLEAVWKQLVQSGAGVGLQPLGFEALELLRVEAGQPRFGQDMGETTIPLEANLQHAISYNKGCYIGQEVIARATFRGHMNRKLTGLLLSAEGIAPGTLLKRGEKKVGWLTSVIRSPKLGRPVALGYVHRDFLDAGTELSVGEGPEKAFVQSLPFALGGKTS